MKPSKTQMIIAYAASTFLMLAVFHKPLRLADYWETAFLIATGLCWITFFLFAPSAEIQSHDVRGAGLATEPCAAEKCEVAISDPHDRCLAVWSTVASIHRHQPSVSPVGRRRGRDLHHMCYYLPRRV